MNRAAGLARLANETFDVLVIGGGATGLGTAVDAAARGYRTALIEADDVAAATSSRSTKLIHGGVRYLRQGDIGLVREALRERTLLRRNAPHLVHELSFVVPVSRWAELPSYAAGLAAYDALAGRSGFARSRVVSSRAARALVPGLRSDALRAAVVYSDAQFDDARLAVTLARTAVDRGAAVANGVRATGFLYEGGRVRGVNALDRESGATFPIRSRTVVNASGIFADAVRALDAAGAAPLLTHSRGSHIVVAARAAGGAHAALLVPKTVDGRVLFAVPWHGHVVIGTTDVPAAHAEADPQPTAGEIDALLATVNRVLQTPLARSDVLAAWAGLRPLVNRRAVGTAQQSREHVVAVSPSGLVTIAGGKWTTYRRMAQDAVDAAVRSGDLTPAPCTTALMPLHGAAGRYADDPALRVYGSDADAVQAIADAEPALAVRLHPALPYTGAHAVYAIRHEMARTVEDVLARRTRARALNAAAAAACEPAIAALLEREREPPAVSP